MTMDQATLVSLLVFLLVSQAVWALVGSSTNERQKALQRLTTYTAPTFGGGLHTRYTVLRRRRYSRFPILDMVLARFDLADGTTSQLQQAGLPLRAGEFLFMQLVAATICGLIGALVGAETLGALPAAAVGLLLGWFGPIVWLRLRVSQRRSMFEQGLPESLDRITGALRAGFGIEYGLDMVARDSEGPCAEEFGQVLQELNLGADLDEALARLLLRVNSEDARLLTTAVAVQRRTGGNLIEVLGQMSTTLRERERLRRDVRVITTAPRVSGYVVALLPLLTVVAMYFTSRYYIEALLADPVGRLAAAASAGLCLIGLYINHRIADVSL
jgi:tight adherence protein B